MNEIKQNSPYAWFLAARPKTLTGAIIPVLLGSALAFSDGQFKTAPALLCALFACGMQIAANFINDLFDFQKGTDRREDRLGPQRACAEGWITPAAMKTGIGIALTLSCLAGLAVPCCAPSLPAACRLPPTLSTTSSTSRKGPTVGKTGWGRSAPAPKVGLRRQP